MQPAEAWSQRPHRLIVSGAIAAGKTTWCRALIEQARAAGATVGGLLSPAIFEGGVKTGIGLVNLATGEQRTLAMRRTADDDAAVGLVTAGWRFDSSVMDWGNTVLRATGAVDLLVIDELGPLELVRGKGWQAALTLLDAGQYGMACVVVRAGLLPVVLTRWPDAQVFKAEAAD